MKKIEAYLIEAFILINKYLEKHSIRYCLIGGIAAGYWGEPRYTQDIDFTVVSRTGSLKELLHQLRKDGFAAKEKGKDQLQVTEKGDLKFQVDFILAETDYQDWLVQRSTPVPMFGVNVPICSAEDLIILKLIANRRRDLLDIESVLKYQKSRLDKVYLKKWFQFWELEERFQKEFGDL